MALPTFVISLLGEDYTVLDVDGDQTTVINLSALPMYDQDILSTAHDDGGWSTFRETLNNELAPNGRLLNAVYGDLVLTVEDFTERLFKVTAGDTTPLGSMAVRNNPTNTVTITTPCVDDNLSDIVIGTKYLPIGGFVQEKERGIVLQSGGLQVPVTGDYVVSGWASCRHSQAASTVGILFVINRGGTLINTPSAVPTKMPNSNDLGGIAGGGAVPLQAGDIVIPYVASNKTGTVTINNISIIAFQV